MEIRLCREYMTRQVEDGLFILLYRRYLDEFESRQLTGDPLSPDEFLTLIGGSHPSKSTEGQDIRLYVRTTKALYKRGMADWSLNMTEKSQYDMLIELHKVFTHDLLIKQSNFDWPRGRYNDMNSCYFGQRNLARKAIADSKARVWVVDKDDENSTPVCRMWSWPLTEDNKNWFFTNTYGYGPRNLLQSMVATHVARYFGSEFPIIRHHDPYINLKVDRQGATSGLVYINAGSIYVLEETYGDLSKYPHILDVLRKMDKRLIRVNKSGVSIQMNHGYIKKRGRYVHVSMLLPQDMTVRQGTLV